MGVEREVGQKAASLSVQCQPSYERRSRNERFSLSEFRELTSARQLSGRSHLHLALQLLGELLGLRLRPHAELVLRLRVSVGRGERLLPRSALGTQRLHLGVLG